MNVAIGVWELLCLAGMLLAAVGGAAALWLVLRSRSAGQPRCGQCGYSVRGLTTMTCPECGADLREVGIVGGAKRPTAAPPRGEQLDSTAPPTRSRALTIMCVDLADTARAAALPQARRTALLRHMRDVIEPVVEDSDGQIVMTVADRFIVTFDHATDAVLTGIAIQRTCDVENDRAAEEDTLRLRIGISTGEATPHGHDVTGPAVQLAARVLERAQSGQVWFDEPTWHTMDKGDAPSEPAGDLEIEPAQKPLRLYRAAAQ